MKLLSFLCGHPVRLQVCCCSGGDRKLVSLVSGHPVRLQVSVLLHFIKFEPFRELICPFTQQVFFSLLQMKVLALGVLVRESNYFKECRVGNLIPEEPY